MNLGSLFFTKYKTFNSFFKFILCWILVIALILWLIGNLTKVDCLVTSIFMMIVMFFIFYMFNTQIVGFIDFLLDKIVEVKEVLV